MTLEEFFPFMTYIAAGIAMGAGAIGAGIGEGYAASLAAKATAERDDYQGPILRMMLVGQAVTETSGIFALVIALVLVFNLGGEATSLPRAAALLGAGISVGFGAIGSGIGGGFPSGAAAAGLTIAPRYNATLLRTMLIGQATAQSPSVFALIVSLLLIFFT